MGADIEELENLDTSEIYARRLNATEIATPKSDENSVFSVTDGTVKLSGGGSDFRTNPKEAKSSEMIFEENRTGIKRRTQ